MRKYLLAILSLVALFLASCNHYLDRKSLTTMNDETYWTSEATLRLFANGFYENYFVGYNSGWGTAYAPLRGYNFADDFTSSGKQSNFENSVPASRSSVSETPSMLSNYSGPNWNFAYVRKSNLMLNRITNLMQTKLTKEEFAHWTSVARFFRGFEYSRLVSVFGDVPYFDDVVLDIEIEKQYKDRDSRVVVMDKVAEDFEYVLTNMRLSDGDPQYLNKYIAASYISRLMLFEGTWQKYHLNNQAASKKYLELAVKAAQFVINSGKYKFDTDFRSLFGSFDLSGKKEVIMYRHYDAALKVTHHIASYSNVYESQSPAPNLNLAKSFICNDGKTYQESSLENAKVLDLSNMIKTRDPRFEATFYEKPVVGSSTLLYACKFIDRVGPTYYGSTYPPQYCSSTNTNDAPDIRYAEVVLNWVEAKAELATMGGASVTQDDIDKSINAIRNRPLDQVAIAKGIKKTAAIQLASLPNDPAKDAEVSALIWEIRRERRMEFVYEFARLNDLRRWKKLDNMSATKNPDLLRGLWIDFNKELPAWLSKEKVNVLRVEKADGTIITYNGSNAAEMVGYFVPEKVQDRDEFSERNYLAPVGEQQINQYKEKGYNLTQTKLW